MPLHPQAASFLALLASLDQPPIETQEPARARAARAALVPPSTIEVAEVHDLDLGGVPGRHYRAQTRPGRIPGVLVWLHGGGWVLGSVDGHDDLCRDLCRRSGLDVISV